MPAEGDVGRVQGRNRAGLRFADPGKGIPEPRRKQEIMTRGQWRTEQRRVWSRRRCAAGSGNVQRAAFALLAERGGVGEKAGKRDGKGGELSGRLFLPPGAMGFVFFFLLRAAQAALSSTCWVDSFVLTWLRGD